MEGWKLCPASADCLEKRLIFRQMIKIRAIKRFSETHTKSCSRFRENRREHVWPRCPLPVPCNVPIRDLKNGPSAEPSCTCFAVFQFLFSPHSGQARRHDFITAQILSSRNNSPLGNEWTPQGTVDHMTERRGHLNHLLLVGCIRFSQRLGQRR
jgi:hypothetical protein